MNAGIELLFDEFAARHARGEHPDALDYLERAGEGRDELALLLDGYLAAAPVQLPSEETLATFAELVPGDHETPPMLAVRIRMRLRRADVVRQLRVGLGLDASTEDKVSRYYHELETGLLDPRGVSSRVWHCLATVLGTGIRSLMVSPHEPPPALMAAYYRRSDLKVAAEPALEARLDMLSTPEQPERDEVDMLFTGNA
jgi:hypothetical protein